MKDVIMLEITDCQWDSTGCPADPEVLSELKILDIQRDGDSDYYEFLVDTDSANIPSKEPKIQSASPNNKDMFQLLCEIHAEIEIVVGRIERLKQLQEEIYAVLAQQKHVS